MEKRQRNFHETFRYVFNRSCRNNTHANLPLFERRIEKRVQVLSRRASDTHARARQSGETLTCWPSHPRTRHIRLIFHTRFCTRGNYNNNRPLVMRASNRCPAWPPFVLWNWFNIFISLCKSAMLRERNARLFAFPFVRLFPPLKPFQLRACFSLSFSLSSMSVARGHTSFRFLKSDLCVFFE